MLKKTPLGGNSAPLLAFGFIGRLGMQLLMPYPFSLMPLPKNGKSSSYSPKSFLRVGAIAAPQAS